MASRRHTSARSRWLTRQAAPSPPVGARRGHLYAPCQPPHRLPPHRTKHNCQAGCELTLRWRLRGFSCTPSSRGEHPATNDPVQDEAKARHADRVKHLPPLRALVQLLSEHVPEEAGMIRFIRSGLPHSEIPNQNKALAVLSGDAR